jgi:hypothetical protein
MEKKWIQFFWGYYEKNTYLLQFSLNLGRNQTCVYIKKETRRFIFLSFSFVFLFLFLSQINKSDLILFFLRYSYFHSFFSKHTNYMSLRSHDLRCLKLWAINIILNLWNNHYTTSIDYGQITTSLPEIRLIPTELPTE